MKSWSHLVLVVTLALLPLRGWAQAVMLVGDMGMPAMSCPATAASSEHAMPMAHAAMDKHMAHAGPAPSGCAGDHEHQLCTVCSLAAASLPARFATQTSQVQAPCPAAICTSWDSADPRALLRPPRL